MLRTKHTNNKNCQPAGSTLKVEHQMCGNSISPCQFSKPVTRRESL